jgi:hypothetical protein
MKRNHSSCFLEQYSGPYAYRPGSDGVDATFDVYCTKTDNTIISSRYWDEEKQAETVACAVTGALNSLHDYPEPNTLAQQRAFKAIYPGPYRSHTCSDCEWPFHEVVCETTKECVIYVDADVDDPYVTSVMQHVACALNQWPNAHQRLA